MAADQKNFQLFTYVDDNGVSWNKRGELDAARNAVDGNAAFGAHPNWGRETARHRTRKIIYQDATTFRTKTVVFYTAAAYTAVALGDIIAFHVEGEVAAVNYNAIKKVPERQPAAAGSRQLADHAQKRRELVTFFDWLASPGGVQLEHAVVLLIVSLAAWFAKLARDQSRDNARLLNGHIEEHAMGAAHENEASPP